MHSRGDHQLSNVNKLGRSETTTQNQPFTKVDDDILFVIFEKLELIDQIRAKTVCKKWLKEITKIPYQHQGKFPWLLSYKPFASEVKVTHESSKRSYIFDQPRQQHFEYVEICASKFGWILMVSKEWSKFDISKLYKFFVYCPFNSKLMNLPTYSCAHVDIRTKPYQKYTFSSDPTLPDCVFFALFGNCFKFQTIEMHTCRIGDKEWTNFKINLSIKYVRYFFECINELLYVVLLRENVPSVYSDPILNSHVGTFDAKSQEWKLLKNEKGFMKSNNENTIEHPSIWEQPVVYNNKELYLFREMGNMYQKYCDVFKYDMEEKKWVEQPSLGNRVLFIGHFGSSFLVDAVGKLSNMANNAFFAFRGSPYYPHSFRSRMFVPCYDRR